MTTHHKPISKLCGHECSFISTKPSEKIFKDLDLCIDWLESNKEGLLIPVPAASCPAEGTFVRYKLQSLAGRPFDFDKAKKELFEEDPRHKFGSQFSSTEETLEKQVVSLVSFFAKYFNHVNPVTGDFWSYATVSFDYSRSLDETEQAKMLTD
ncbi:hypothetical protein BDR26DRAFT_872668, partial [Obelidium mucronatum]